MQQSNSSLKVGTDAMLLGASVGESTYKYILDIGTGTGVLALMAKQKNPKAKVTAIDIDKQPLIDCKANFENSPWKDDLNCLQQNFMDFIPENQFDFVICNPPYYENGFLSETASNNRAKHTIDFSLESLFQKTKEWLTPNGRFRIILPYSTAEKWSKFGNSIQLFTIRKQIIFGKPDLPKRTILTLGLSKTEPEEDFLIIRNEDNSYTKEYKELTKEFHNREL